MKHAAILGLQHGNIWAKSHKFDISDDEIKTLLANLDDLMVLNKTNIKISGDCYETKDISHNVLSMSSCQDVLHLAKTKKTLVVGVSDDQLSLHQAKSILNALAVGLSNRGF